MLASLVSVRPTAAQSSSTVIPSSPDEQPRSAVSNNSIEVMHINLAFFIPLLIIIANLVVFI
jgi:hypothetical protein